MKFLFYYYLLFFIDIQNDFQYKLILNLIIYFLILYELILFKLHFKKKYRKYKYSFIENIILFYRSLNQVIHKQLLQKIKKNRKSFSLSFDVLKAITYAFLFALHIKFYVLQIFTVQYNSMIPSLYPKDKVIIEKISMGVLEPRYKIHSRKQYIRLPYPQIRKLKDNDIIIFYLPKHNKNTPFIKRIIGIPNDKIRLLEDGRLERNGVILNETYIKSTSTKSFNQILLPDEYMIKYEKNQYIQIPPNMYYVLGDNRNASQDSRTWGFVHKKNIIGRVIHILKK